MKVLSATQLAKATRCPRKWGLQYIAGLTPKTVSKPLSLGGAIHSALAMYYNSSKVNWDWLLLHLDVEVEIQEEILAETQRVVDAYTEFYGRDLEGQEFLAAEWPWKASVRTPRGTRSNYLMVGRFDLVTRDVNGMLWVWDHKSSRYDVDPLAASMDSQMCTYAWAAHRLHMPIAGVVWNHLRTTKTPTFTRLKLVKPQDAINAWEIALYAQCRMTPSLRADWRELAPVVDKSCSWSCSYLDVCRMLIEGEEEAAVDLIRMEFNQRMTSSYGNQYRDQYNTRIPKDWRKGRSR